MIEEVHGFEFIVRVDFWFPFDLDNVSKNYYLR